MSMKNPLTLAGIEPATFRFVAQHLNHLTAVLYIKIISLIKPITNSVNYVDFCLFLLYPVVLQVIINCSEKPAVSVLYSEGSGNDPANQKKHRTFGKILSCSCFKNCIELNAGLNCLIERTGLAKMADSGWSNVL